MEHSRCIRQISTGTQGAGVTDGSGTRTLLLQLQHCKRAYNNGYLQILIIKKLKAYHLSIPLT